MDSRDGAPSAEQLATIPVRTDADMLARVDAVIAPAARQDRALWLLLFYDDGTQAPVVMPIDMPDLPEPDFTELPLHVMRHFYGPAGSGLSFTLVVCRPGAPDPGAGDRQWARVLQDRIDEYAAPVRMICLATPGGVRSLGPAA
jgi:hypothetical protein